MNLPVANHHLATATHHTDRFITSCTSWDDFYKRTKALPKRSDKGAVFERLTQLFLQTTPEYRTELQHVWLLREVPADIRKRLNLPGPDEGIDLIARTRRGEYWAIQTKFRREAGLSAFLWCRVSLFGIEQSAVRILGISAFNEIPLSVQQDKRLAGLGIA